MDETKLHRATHLKLHLRSKYSGVRKPKYLHVIDALPLIVRGKQDEATDVFDEELERRGLLVVEKDPEVQCHTSSPFGHSHV